MFKFKHKPKESAKSTSIPTNLKDTIRNKLRHSREHCKFKRSFLPEGWTCVHIDTFAEELSDKIQGPLTINDMYGEM